MEETQCRLSAFILKHFSVLLHLNIDTMRRYFFEKDLFPLVVVVYVKNLYVRVSFRGNSTFLLYHLHLDSVKCFKYMGEHLPFGVMIWGKRKDWQ